MPRILLFFVFMILLQNQKPNKVDIIKPFNISKNWDVVRNLPEIIRPVNGSIDI